MCVCVHVCAFVPPCVTLSRLYVCVIHESTRKHTQDWDIAATVKLIEGFDAEATAAKGEGVERSNH